MLPRPRITACVVVGGFLFGGVGGDGDDEGDEDVVGGVGGGRARGGRPGLWWEGGAGARCWRFVSGILGVWWMR